MKQMMPWLESLSLMSFRSERTAFYRELARSIESREQLRSFLSAELAISRNPSTRNSSRATALALMQRQLSMGNDYRLSHLLGRVMPQSDRLMLSALDFSSDRPATLRSLADAIEQQKRARQVIGQSLLPPLILLPGVAGFCHVLATQSIPVIVKMAPPAVWTPFNQSVRSFAEVIQRDGGWLMLATVCTTVLVTCALPRWTGRARSQLENLKPRARWLLFPVFPLTLALSVYRDFQVSQLLNALAVLLESGMTLTEALQRLRRHAQPWMRSHLQRVLAHLQVAPTDYVPAFSRGLMSPALLAAVASAVRNNPRFDQVLIELGTRENVHIQNHIAKTAKRINSTLVASCGVLVLFLYLGQLSITQSMTAELSPTQQMLRKAR
jgi:type II secretory pathway component PulF